MTAFIDFARALNIDVLKCSSLLLLVEIFILCSAAHHVSVIPFSLFELSWVAVCKLCSLMHLRLVYIFTIVWPKKVLQATRSRPLNVMITHSLLIMGPTCYGEIYKRIM